MVFYRKYRPQSFNDLVGQDHIKESLTKALLNSRLSHAYLFCGPKGTGKTSTARILAKMVNCGRQDIAPCNKCDQCVSITDGSNLDLVEIDAASNRGIDDIRTLKENIKLSPAKARKKVYIIDEVHMLTNEAFNALLKTLEEPPEHCLFILATTQVQKIPETILSRVVKLDFKLADSSDLKNLLKKIIKEEKIDIEEEALEVIIKLSEGSFRDATKILDSLGGKNEKITLKAVSEIVQTGNRENQINLLKAIAENDGKKALDLFLSQLNLGINVKEYLVSILDILRSVLLLKYETKNKDLDKDLSEIESVFSLDNLISVINLFQEAFEKMKFASIQSLPLEVAIIECSQLEIKEKLKQDIKMVVVGQDSLRDDSILNAPDSEMPIIIDKWNYILETIKPHNFSLEALLRSVKVLECIGGKVLIEVPYSFHKRILETPKSKTLLESVLSDVLGKPVGVKTVLGKRPDRPEELSNVEIAADDEIIKLASEIFNSDGGI